MPSNRDHFESRAESLADCADLVTNEGTGGSVTLTLVPRNPEAVGVVLYLGLASADHGTVNFDDPASVPGQLDDSSDDDRRCIDWFIDEAVEGRVTAHRVGTGGAIEVREPTGGLGRTHAGLSASLPGWRLRRTKAIAYQPYRSTTGSNPSD